MNPLSLLLIGIGLIMVYIGWKGSQHTVVADLLGHGASQSTPATGKTTPKGTTPAKGGTVP